MQIRNNLPHNIQMYSVYKVLMVDTNKGQRDSIPKGKKFASIFLNL